VLLITNPVESLQKKNVDPNIKLVLNFGQYLKNKDLKTKKLKQKWFEVIHLKDF